MQKPFSGITLLDLTHDLGRYTGRLFADLGADVIRIEPPGGLADRRDADADIASSAHYAFEFPGRLEIPMKSFVRHATGNGLATA